MLTLVEPELAAHAAHTTHAAEALFKRLWFTSLHDARRWHQPPHNSVCSCLISPTSNRNLDSLEVVLLPRDPLHGTQCQTARACGLSVC